MDIARDSGIFSQLDLRFINACRLSLDVTTISDIANLRGPIGLGHSLKNGCLHVCHADHMAKIDICGVNQPTRGAMTHP